MDLKEEVFLKYLEKYQQFVFELSKVKKYPSNLTHLLNLIVPAFIFKYGLRYEKLLLDMFSNVTIIIQEKHAEVVQASFARKLIKDGDGYSSLKYIYLYRYEQTGLMELLENLIHEFNHAVNSLKNEIRYDEKYVYLRSGLTSLVYDRNTLSALEKQDEVILEEIINTHQSNELLEVIASFNKYAIPDSTLRTSVETVARLYPNYQSRAYYLQTMICKRLLENTTFIRTLEDLRFQGEVQEMEEWFDTIVGKQGSYKRLQVLLLESFQLEEKLQTQKWFRKKTLSKLRNLSQELFALTFTFDQNCNFR